MAQKLPWPRKKYQKEITIYVAIHLEKGLVKIISDFINPFQANFKKP